MCGAVFRADSRLDSTAQDRTTSAVGSDSAFGGKHLARTHNTRDPHTVQRPQEGPSPLLSPPKPGPYGHGLP